MENIRKYFREHFFSSILLLLVVITASASFYRFLVINDYLVLYEGICDPFTKKCFVGCENDECTQEYYYMEVEKYAPDLLAQCGKDITDCEAAIVCLPTERHCSITYCEEEIENNICDKTDENQEEKTNLEESLTETNI